MRFLVIRRNRWFFLCGFLAAGWFGASVSAEPRPQAICFECPLTATAAAGTASEVAFRATHVIASWATFAIGKVTELADCEARKGPVSGCLEPTPDPGSP